LYQSSTTNGYEIKLVFDLDQKTNKPFQAISSQANSVNTRFTLVFFQVYLRAIGPWTKFEFIALKTQAFQSAIKQFDVLRLVPFTGILTHSVGFELLTIFRLSN